MSVSLENSKENSPLLPRNSDSPPRALFVVSGVDIQTPTEKGFIGDKFDELLKELQALGWVAETVIGVRGRRPLGKSTYRLHFFRQYYIFALLTCVARLLFDCLPVNVHGLRQLNFRALRLAHERLLDKFRPSVILGIGLNEFLLEAAKSRSIPTIEIQHGNISAESFYTTKNPTHKPQFFFAWDPASARIARSLGMSPVTVGFPTTLKSSVRMTRDESRDWCVCLSYDVSVSEDKWGLMSKPLWQEVLALHSRGEGIRFRLHPVSLKNPRHVSAFEKWVSDRLPGVKIDNPLETPLSESIERSVGAVTHSSTIWFEFAMAGRPTLVTDLHWRSVFTQQALELNLVWGNVPPLIASAHKTSRGEDPHSHDGSLWFSRKRMSDFFNATLGI